MISIITPVYNGERFIEFCIKNVIDQACPDVEHIIVDGESTDKTVEIIKQYAEKYSHIRWISEKDSGQSEAMNKGISMAKGEILSFLNVDDFYEQNVLNRVLNIIKTLPEPSLLVGNFNIWNDDGSLMEVTKASKLRLFDLLRYYVNPFPYNPSSYFYHTSLHQKIGGYKINEHYAMDYDFILRAVQVATVKYVDEIWGNWRLIKGTKTDSVRHQGLLIMDGISKNYRKDLPLLQWLQLNIEYLFYKHFKIKRRVKHYLTRLQDLLAKFKAIF